MTKIFNVRLVLLTSIIVSMGLMTACKKDKVEVNSGKTQLLSFGPTGALHGDTIVFIGNNLDKVTEVDLTGANVAKASFLQQTSEMISFVIPESAERGYVTLITPEGNIISKTRLDLNVPVAVSAMPALARPGESITLTGNYLNWVTYVVFGKDKYVDSSLFVSKTLHQLVVKVPVDAQTGTLFIGYGGTEPDEIETDSSLNITLPFAASLSPNPIEREADLTITGTNLDLVHGVLFTGKPTADTVFVSKTATQLVVKVPKEANKGTIKLVAYSGVTVESAESIKIVGDLPPLDDFPYAIYTDALQNSFSDYSWAKRHDFASVSNVRQGTKSIEAEYGTGGYEGVTFHNDAGIATADYTKLELSIFGEAGTGGKTMNVVTNGTNWGSPNKFEIVEGEWRTITINLSDIPDLTVLKEIVLQSAGWSGVVHIDHVGLRK